MLDRVCQRNAGLSSSQEPGVSQERQDVELLDTPSLVPGPGGLTQP